MNLPEPTALADQLTDGCRRFGIPGAVVGIDAPDARVVATHGVLNARTAVPTTRDSLFQVGSISKLYTATLVGRLVTDGRLAFDEPLISVLGGTNGGDALHGGPVADPGLTLAHLLDHTSGLDGDVFGDAGRGDDCLARYVAETAPIIPRLHELGETWAYCNAGYALLGRVVERVTGKRWDDAVRAMLLTPLASRATVTLADDAILHSAATGHVHAPGEPFRPASVWGIPRAMGPAGAITAPVDDVLDFARAHLDTAAGRRDDLLPTALSRSMMAARAELPDPYGGADSWGLGWMRTDWNGTRVVGHDGGTVGQTSFLRLLPSHDAAVVLCTNGGAATDLYETMLRDVLRASFGIEPPPALDAAADAQVDTAHAAALAGRYARTGHSLFVEATGAGAVLRHRADGVLPGAPAGERATALLDAGDGRFVVRWPGQHTPTAVTFWTSPTTGARYLYTARRAHRLVDG